MDALTVIEDYLGEELTSEGAARLAEAPEEQLLRLVERLDACYEQWFAQEEATRTAAPADAAEPFYCLEPFELQGEARANLERYKKFLLYFPRLAAPDPLADVLYAPLVAAVALGAVQGTAPLGFFPWSERLRQQLGEALALVAELAPAVRRRALILLPRPYLAYEQSVQEAAQATLTARSGDETYYGAIREAARSRHTIDAYALHLATLKAESEAALKPADGPFRAAQFLPLTTTLVANGSEEVRGGIAWLIAEELAIAGQICARLSYTPVAGDDAVWAALRQEYARALPEPAQKVQRAADLLVRYEIPGLRRAALQDVLRLRDADVFATFRRDVGTLIDRVHQEAPADQGHFELELRQAADDLLQPRVEALNKSLDVSVFDLLLKPAALTFGTALLAQQFLGVPLHTALTIEAALASGPSWAASKLFRRWSRGGRQARVLYEAYAMLLDRS